MSNHWVPAKSVLDTGVEGLKLNDVRRDTVAIASKPEPVRRPEVPLVMPIHQSSTYKMNSVDHYLDIVQNSGYLYSRLGNPNLDSVECVVKNLEGGAGSLAFSSGMAAITTALLGVLRAGDHIICCNPVYAGTHKFIDKDLTNLNIEYTWVKSGCSVEEYRKHIKKNTRVLFGETPCNPLISVLDMEAFGKLGAQLGDEVFTMVDATYASPFLLQPIKYGVDIVIHSATKYMNGHSDLLGGVITTRTVQQWKKLNIMRATLGGILSSPDCALLVRGLRTLPLRMERHCDNAQSLAEFLEAHPAVESVHYPGLKSHPAHNVARKQMKRFGGMIALEMKGGLQAAKTLVENVRLIQLAVSLGGVESLMEHPASMTHGPMIMTDKERAEGLITPGLIRFSVGLENVEDLKNDLQQALDLLQDDTTQLNGYTYTGPH